jgi:hypothetical protein
MTKADGNELSSNSWSTIFPISRKSSDEERKTPLEVERKLKTAGEAVPLTRVKCLVSMTIIISYINILHMLQYL